MEQLLDLNTRKVFTNINNNRNIYSFCFKFFIQHLVVHSCMYIDLCIKKISFLKYIFIDTFLLQQLVSYENKTDTRNIGCYLSVNGTVRSIHIRFVNSPGLI